MTVIVKISSLTMTHPQAISDPAHNFLMGINLPWGAYTEYLIHVAEAVGFLGVGEVFEHTHTQTHLLPVQGEPHGSTLQAVCNVLHCVGS
jgi:hypothetical protein